MHINQSQQTPIFRQQLLYYIRLMIII